MEQEDADRARQEADAAAARAIRGITELIVATLKESVDTRFEEVGRLCEVARSLMKARGKRVADFAPRGRAAEDQAMNQAMNQAVAQAFNNVPVIGNGLNAAGYVINAGNAGVGNIQMGPVQF